MNDQLANPSPFPPTCSLYYHIWYDHGSSGDDDGGPYDPPPPPFLLPRLISFCMVTSLLLCPSLYTFVPSILNPLTLTLTSPFFQLIK